MKSISYLFVIKNQFLVKQPKVLNTILMRNAHCIFGIHIKNHIKLIGATLTILFFVLVEYHVREREKNKKTNYYFFFYFSLIILSEVVCFILPKLGNEE